MVRNLSEAVKKLQKLALVMTSQCPLSGGLRLLGADVYACDVYACDVYACDVYACDVYACDVYAPPIKGRDLHAPGLLGAWTFMRMDFYAPGLLGIRGKKNFFQKNF